jgi:hypothetical protein
LGFSGFGNVNHCGSFFVAAADTEVSDLQIYILDGNLLWTKINEQVKKIDMCGAKGISLMDQLVGFARKKVLVLN